jgi:hypothetical protein
MSGPFTWNDRGDERLLHLDPAGTPGGRYLAVRRQPGADDDWMVACALRPGEPEEEYGDGLAGRGVAEDVALKVAIQGLARLHRVSPVPGLPDAEASDAEHLIARLWLTLSERWAPGGMVPGGLAPGGAAHGPAAGEERDEGGGGDETGQEP